MKGRALERYAMEPCTENVFFALFGTGRNQRENVLDNCLQLCCSQIVNGVFLVVSKRVLNDKLSVSLNAQVLLRTSLRGNPTLNSLRQLYLFSCIFCRIVMKSIGDLMTSK